MLDIDVSTKQKITCIDPFNDNRGHGGIGNFGDYVTYCSCLLRLAETNKEKDVLVRCRPKTKDYLKLLKPIFDSEGDFFFEDELGFDYIKNIKNITWHDLFNHNLVPTKKRWKAYKNRRICYQFDGHSDADAKNLRSEEMSHFLSNCHKLSYFSIDIGHFKPMDYILDNLANCAMFVGVPSGMASLAMHVGKIPIYVITNRYSDNFLQKLKYRYAQRPDLVMFKNIFEFINILKKPEKELKPLLG